MSETLFQEPRRYVGFALEDEASFRPRGIGLGLPRVERILERHDGSILHAPHPGHGARFVPRLPLTSSSPPDMP